jgi:hypothetical protein
MVQGKKMKTPRELYLQSLDKDYRKTPIQRFCYTFSMDARKKAAQATIDFCVKPKIKLPFKNSRGPYSESETSSCEEKYVSNSNSPSPASLKDFTNGLPHFEPLHVGFYLNDDKTPSCLCPCVKGVTCWRESFRIDWENKELCRFCLLLSIGLLQHYADKGGSYHRCNVYYLQKLDVKPGKAWTDASTSDGNQKGDVVPGIVDKNESIYSFVIDRQGSFW